MSETSAVQRAKEQVAVQTAATKAENAVDRTNLIFEDIARRAFDIFEAEGRVFGHDIENWFKAERELLHPVNIELTETEEVFEIKAEVPGFVEKDLEVRVEPGRVVIAGKREASAEQKKGKVIRSETRAEQLLRVIELPGPVDAAKVRAILQRNGILAVTLPKPKAVSAESVAKPAVS